MKTYRIFYGIMFSVMLSLSLGLSGCDDDDDDDRVLPDAEIVTFMETELTGTQEVPPVTTQATGTFKGTYNKSTRRISYTITFQGITPIGMHFHRGGVGVDGPIVVDINPGSDPYSGTNPFVSPLNGISPALTQAQEAELLSGQWYVNVHSSQFPDGELRGQVTQ